MQNLVKIGRCPAELLRIFDFQNGDHPRSWIWYDVMADNPRLVFDGPGILLKLHIDRVNIHAHFGGYDGVPFGIGFRRKGSKTRVLGLQDGRKSFKIRLAV